MSASLNRVMIIGHLGRDPELKYTQTGTPVATLSIATSENYTDKSGNKGDRTEWHRVVVWERQAETCNQYLCKGSLVYVEGSLQTRQWQDQQGQTRYTTEIRAHRVQFLSTRDQDGGGGTHGQGYSHQGGQQHPQGQQSGTAPDDDQSGPIFPSEIDQMPF